MRGIPERTTDQVALRFHVSAGTVARWCAAGILRAVKRPQHGHERWLVLGTWRQIEVAVEAAAHRGRAMET